jgi:hypothetical protein
VTARRYKRQPWTMAEETILSARYPNEPTAALARELQRPVGSVYQHALKIGLKKSAEYMAGPHACRLRRGDNVGARYRFKPGQAPHNKGKEHPAGRSKECAAHHFRKGMDPRGWAANIYQPIGAERISKDGYLERKVNDDQPAQRRWRLVHLLTWEAAHGPVPKGHAVVFINGDKRDIRLENLECITRQALMARNTVHRYPKPIAEAIQLLGALRRQIRKRTNAQEQNR